MGSDIVPVHCPCAYPHEQYPRIVSANPTSSLENRRLTWTQVQARTHRLVTGPHVPNQGLTTSSDRTTRHFIDASRHLHVFRILNPLKTRISESPRIVSRWHLKPFVLIDHPPPLPTDRTSSILSIPSIMPNSRGNPSDHPPPLRELQRGSRLSE